MTARLLRDAEDVALRFELNDGERWSDALFVHYAVDSAKLQSLLPPALAVDEHDGCAYVGIVALTESAIIPFPPGVPLWLGPDYATGSDFLRAIGVHAPSWANFRKMRGKGSGASNKMYHNAYRFFEQKRLHDKKPKTKGQMY